MRRTAPWTLALSLLPLVPAASAQPPDPALVAENSYREALAHFTAGRPERAVSRVVDLESGSSAECVRAIELRTAVELAKWEPEALLVLAYVRLGARHARHLERRVAAHLFEFERVSMRGLRQLADLYVATSRRSDASSVAAGLLTYMAHGVAVPRSTQRVAAGGDLLEAALELDPDHVAGLHSLAVFLELRGRYGQSLSYLDRLLALEPRDPRFRVRRAMVTLKSGRRDRGRLLLEELTTDGPVWVRDLATQELARLLSAAGREDEAESLLRDGLRELPREKLSLQLAGQLDPRWADSWEVLGAWLAEAKRDAGPSARWIYENGVKDDVEALRVELGAAVSERSAGLQSALSRLPEPAESDPKNRAACR